MNVTITNLDEAEMLTLTKWVRKHTSNPYLTMTVTEPK